MAEFNALTAYQSLTQEDQVRFLLRFCWWLTLVGRNYYEPGTEELRFPAALRAVNELQHQVTQHALALLTNDQRRYPDDVLVAILFDDVPDPSGLAEQVRQAFTRAFEEAQSCSLTAIN